MKTEYEVLRQEIIEWQSRRFNLISITIAIVTAIIGLVVNNPAKWSWPMATSVIWIVLTCTCFLTWLIGQINTRIGTYIEVFHETDGDKAWESRNRQFGLRIMNLNTGLSMIYLGLASISFIIPFAFCSKEPQNFDYIIFGISAAIFIGVFVILTFMSYPRDRYVDQWRKIKGQNNCNNCNIYN